MTKTGPRDTPKLAAIKLEWWPRSDWNRWPPSLESAHLAAVDGERLHRRHFRRFGVAASSGRAPRYGGYSRRRHHSGGKKGRRQPRLQRAQEGEGRQSRRLLRSSLQRDRAVRGGAG